jgi:hypothetical protein
MTREGFDKWLMGMKSAWENKDPKAAADLCAENVIYHETVFGEPCRSKEDVRIEWEAVPAGQKDIKFDYKILSVGDAFGLAHWTAEFIRIPSEEKAQLDGIFKVSLDENNLCTEFYQWVESKK